MGAPRWLPSLLAKTRVRLVLGFVAAFLGMAVFGGVSYRFFTWMEDKLYFLSRADQMVNMVLEVRRYEKNYLLYRDVEDLRQALVYLGQFEEIMEADQEHIGEGLGRETAARLARDTRAYRQALEQVQALPRPEAASQAAPEDLVRSLRTAGKDLIELCETLAARERASLGGLLRDYRPVLVFFLLGLGLVVAGMVYLLLVRLVKPLHMIEEATKLVAHGDFRPISWASSNDEISSLVRAFNQMVMELQENREQMIQTEKLTSLGTLTSGVAHELNNPLNNISTSCQILLEEMGPSSNDYHRELLDTIEDQVAKARDIVRSLLDFARQRDFQLSTEDLLGVVQDAVKLMKGELPAQVDLEIQVPEGIQLRLDKAHMIRALLNLIQNGIQASEGRGRLCISARRSDDDKEAVIEVRDEGAGISPEILPRIFDPFFTTKEVGQGTGLGLSITYGIVERHQGRIHAESRPGQGSCFVIHLPLAPGEA